MLITKTLKVMKKVINLCLIVCFILFSTIAKASNALSVKIKNSSTIKLSLSNISNGQKLYLKDYSGNIIFHATLNAMPLYTRHFNFSKVKNGIYFVESETESEIRITSIVKDVNGISIVKDSAITIIKPKVQVNGLKVKVMMTNIDVQLKVSIYNRNGLLIFKEEIEENKFGFQRVYNFSSLPIGKYIIHFKLKDRTFVKEISV